MVRERTPIPHEFIPIGAADEAIEQTIPVNVAGFFSVNKETDAAKTMDAGLHAGPPAHFGFHFTHRPETHWTKQAGRAE